MNATDTDETVGQRIERVAAELGLSMTAEFIPFSQSRNKAEKSPSLNWRVTIRNTRNTSADERGAGILTTDYGAGCGRCPSYKASVKELGNRNSVLRDEVIRWECEHGKQAKYYAGTGQILGGTGAPILPALADVLSSLVSDASVIDCGSFEQWASDLGYDTDSRKAEAIYRACIDIALKLRAAIGDAGLTKLREACQDY